MTEPIDVRRLYEALVRTWPRTWGNRLSWSQPSIEMAAAATREYERLTPKEEPRQSPLAGEGGEESPDSASQAPAADDLTPVAQL
jgi:hypothetical protein